MKLILRIAFLIITNGAFSFTASATNNNCKPVLTKTEVAIKKSINKLVDNLKLQSFKLVQDIFSDETIEFIDKNSKKVNKEVLRAGYKTKVTLYTYLRSRGIKIKVKVPLDLDLIQKFIDKLINQSGVDLKTKFNVQYTITIDPNLKTGDIFRDDSIIFTPELSQTSILHRFNISGQLSASYIYTLSRKFAGHLNDTKVAKTTEQYIKPIRDVLVANPFFFKPRCRQTKLQYAANIHKNLNIPTTFDKLDDLLIDGDTLIYQKKNIIGLTGGVSNFNNFTRLTANLHKGRVVSLNKIIHKTENPYKTYHMKTYLDSVDTVLQGGISIQTGVYGSDIVSWKPLDRALKKPLRKTLTEIKIGTKEQLTYLISHYFSIDDPRFASIPEHLQEIKNTYNNFVEEYFLPSWSHIKNTSGILFDLREHNTRKKNLDQKLRQIITPLINMAESSKDIVHRNNIEVEKIDTPNCEKINLYPMTNYFTGTKDLREEYFNFSINLFKLAGIKYNQSWKDKFYSFVDQSQTTKYFTQSLLNIDNSSHNLITKQGRNKQMYAITESAKNKGILKFKTLGFNYSFKDTDFLSWDQKPFYSELTNIIPFGKKSEEIKKKYKEIKPFINRKEAYLGYKYLLSEKGFKRISKRVTHEVIKNKNFNFIYSILKNCMTKEDPNYGKKIACIGHLSYYKDYIQYKKHGESNESKENTAKPMKNNTEIIDDAIFAIATKLTLIFLNNDHFYETIDQQDTRVRKLVYKSNLLNVSKNKKYPNSINNAKYSIFNSLVSLGFNAESTMANGEQEVFKDMAPVAIPYLLYYNFRGSDYRSFYIEPNAMSELDDYLYVYALFRSARFNEEERVKPKAITNKDTLNILNKISFFDSNFENVSNMYPYCENNQGELMSIDKLGL